MSPKFLCLLLLSVSCLLTGCENSDSDSDLNEAASKLMGHWIRSNEEEPKGGSVEIYRPASFDFPPSRFRVQYKLLDDGECKWLKASPTDAHTFEDGKWSFDAKTRQLTIEEGATTRIFEMEISDEPQASSMLKLKNVAEK